MKIRNPAVEGRFYPSSREGIFHQIREFEKADRYPVKEMQAERIFGGVLPHAGHMFSGYQTVPFFQVIRKIDRPPETFIIVHPNHTGSGLPLAVDDHEAWRNCIGDVPLDMELAGVMDLPYSRLSHAHEHAGEVIVPYLQYYMGDQPFSIVPVCMMDQRFECARHVAERIRHAVSKLERRVLVLASSDFSHFLSASEGAQKDQLVLDEIVRGNAAGVADAVRRNHITVCGYGPIMVLLEYAAMEDPSYRVKILARGHSGEVVPSREVVDYISMVVYL